MCVHKYSVCVCESIESVTISNRYTNRGTHTTLRIQTHTYYRIFMETQCHCLYLYYRLYDLGSTSPKVNSGKNDCNYQSYNKKEMRIQKRWKHENEQASWVELATSYSCRYHKNVQYEIRQNKLNQQHLQWFAFAKNHIEGYQVSYHLC